MFKIGEFSRFGHVTVKTLRYYDEIGLLKPSIVDPFTGYRRYTAAQLPRLNRILALKELGLTLDQIRLLLEDDVPPDEIRGMLRLKQVELRQQLETEQRRLAQVEWRLRQIEAGTAMPVQEIILKRTPPQPVLSVRALVPTFADVGPLFGEVYGYAARQRIQPAGPSVCLYHDDEFREQDHDVEAAMPVSAGGAPGNRVAFHVLPAVDEAACLVHEGSFETIGLSYNRLLAWIETSGHRPAGPVREVYLQFSEPGAPSNVTEIQAPVCRPA